MNLVECVEGKCKYVWDLHFPEGLYVLSLQANANYYLHFSGRVLKSGPYIHEEYTISAYNVDSVESCVDWKSLARGDLEEIIFPGLKYRLSRSEVDIEGYWDLI